jgi:hypothetical protein
MVKRCPTVDDVLTLLDELSDGNWAGVLHDFQKPLTSIYQDPGAAAHRILWSYTRDAPATVKALEYSPEQFGSTDPELTQQDLSETATYMVRNHVPSLDDAATHFQQHMATVDQLNAWRAEAPDIVSKAGILHQKQRRDAAIRTLEWFDRLSNGDFLQSQKPAEAYQSNQKRDAARVHTLKVKRPTRGRQR